MTEEVEELSERELADLSEEERQRVEAKTRSKTSRTRSEAKIEAARAKRLAASYEAVMATPDGRAVVWDILEMLQVMRTPFIAGSPDLTAFNCGRHNAGLEMWAKLQELAPGEIATMMKESKS